MIGICGSAEKARWLVDELGLDGAINHRADDVPARTKTARRAGLMRLQRQVVAKRQRARVGEHVRVLVDGPSAESPLVLQGRLEGQAPDIDSVVYLSDCDPSRIDAGTFVNARITGARGYDLVASPV